jgi:phosphoribosylformimino-5-aminoimidazole carboxamide ribotide isomerase
MIIFPAVDIRNGKCVRLIQGKADQETVFGDDPAAMGLRWQEAGAQWLHVVDLDGAFTGAPSNLESIRRLRRALAIPMQLGGGIRTLEAIAAYVDLGIDRLILGTVVLKDPELVTRACETYPGKIAIGLDARDGLVAVEGWTEVSSRPVVEVARELTSLNPAAFIYTDISRDGVKKGVNVEATRSMAEAVPVPVIASGGVSSLQDIQALKPLKALGVMGLIIGRALYDGLINLAEAIQLAGDP